jgi:hypothetical protein
VEKVDDKPAAKRARVGEDEENVGPTPAPKKRDGVEEEDDEDEDEDEDEAGGSDLDDESTFPITHEISLKDHTKVRFQLYYPRMY